MHEHTGKPPTLEISWEAIGAGDTQSRRLRPTYVPFGTATDSEQAGSNGSPPSPQALHRGSGIRFSIRSPLSGVLSFCNIGTDGAVRQLLPSPSLPNPVVEAGKWIHLPGSFGTCGPWWRVAEDTVPSSVSGAPETFLFFVTPEPHPAIARSAGAFRASLGGKGAAGVPGKPSPFLDGIPQDAWAWGGTEAEILP